MAHTVSAPVFLRALVAESVSGERICLVSADLLSWPREAVDEHRVVAARAAGTSPENVVLCATHNHSGPQPHQTTLPSIGLPDARFLSALGEALVRAVREAEGALVEVTARRGRIDHDLGQQRRVIVGGKVDHGTNPAGPNDPILTAVGFYDPDERLVAALTHYTCHAVISAENSISGDFPGFACADLERRQGGVSLFLQGCCGDINPGQLTVAGIEVARDAGHRLADAVELALEHAVDLGSDRFFSERVDVELPLDPVLGDATLVDDEMGGRLRAEWCEVMRRFPEREREFETLTVSRLQLCEDFGLIAMNGEMTVEYGLRIRQLFQGDLLPVAYANGMVGYIPRRHHVDEGGYEAVQSAFYYALAGRFTPQVEGIIDDAFEQLTVVR